MALQTSTSKTKEKHARYTMTQVTTRNARQGLHIYNHEQVSTQLYNSVSKIPVHDGCKHRSDWCRNQQWNPMEVQTSNLRTRHNYGQLDVVWHNDHMYMAGTFDRHLGTVKTTCGKQCQKNLHEHWMITRSPLEWSKLTRRPPRHGHTGMGKNP